MSENWSDKLTQLCKDGQRNLGEVSRAVKIELFSGVSNDTPVDTGRLRGNWQTQDGIKPEGELDRTDKDGTTVAAEIEAGASEDGLTYFVNNLPYAYPIEHSRGMVTKNVARVRQVVDEEVRRVRRS